MGLRLFRRKIYKIILVILNYCKIFFNKIISFIVDHWPVVILFLFGIFLIFIRSSGSLNGDEAIYARVASETIERNSWLTLYWRDNFWLEKPPFFIWLEMLMIKSFGFSEIALRFPSGVFGVMNAMLVYFFTFSLFKSRRGGFIAGLVIFSCPLFIVSMRSGMMDTMVTFFIILAIFSIYKGIYNNPKWFYIFYFSVGMGIMVKSIIGIIPILVFVPYVLFNKKFNKEIFYGILILLIIVLPWHIFMSLNFGVDFWNEYLGYHVIDRFQENVINSPYRGYKEVFLERMGIWSIVFLMSILFIKNSIYKYKKEFSFLFFSSTLILIIFSVASTKSPHYILPVIPLLAIILGGNISLLLKEKSLFMIFIAAVSFLNFTPNFILLASDYGESQIFVPGFIAHLLNLSESIYYLMAIFSFCFTIILGLLFYKKHKSIVINCSLIIIVGMNIFIPFYPDRGNFMKEAGLYLSENKRQLSSKYVFVSISEEHRTNTLLAYLPLEMFAEKIKYSKEDLLFENFKNESLCLSLKENPIRYEMGELVHSFDKGDLYKCH